MTFRREVVVKRLKEAKKTAESVQSISKLIIHYHEHVAVSSETWLEVFQQASIESQLALWYVANEVVQTSGNKRRGLGTLFKEAFKPHLERALPLTADNSKNECFLKVIVVWEERKVYDQLFCERLKSIIEFSNSNAGSNYSRSTQDEYVPHVLRSPSNHEQDKKGPGSVYDDQERVARALAISQDFQLTATHELFDKAQKMKGDAEVSRKQYDLNSFDITSMESFKTLKEKAEGVKMKQQFESVARRLEELVEQLESGFQLESQSLDHTLAAEMYFKHQQSEAIVVCKAYKNFGSRITSLRKKLREKKKVLPSLPQSTVPNSANDMELDEEEEEETGQSISVNQEIATANNHMSSPVANPMDPANIIAMKNLEAPPGPGQLNAVSDIMRQLMSRVNGPALPSSSEPSAQSEESSRHHMTSNSSDAAASAFAQQQMTYYGGNPLMASYYGTPYSSATMASNPLPPQSQVNTNAPLPPSDPGDGGGVTTAFFDSMSNSSTRELENTAGNAGSEISSVSAATKQIDQILGNPSEIPNEPANVAISPVKNTFQAAPSFYSPQTTAKPNPYANQPQFPQNANFSQLYPPMASPSFYPNFFNPYQQQQNASPLVQVTQSSDVDLRQTTKPQFPPSNHPPFEPSIDSRPNTQSQDYDSRYSNRDRADGADPNSWNSQVAGFLEDPRKRSRDGSSQNYRGVPPFKRPFGGRYMDDRRGRGSNRGGRGHWNGHDGYEQRDQDYRHSSSNEFGPRGGRGRSHWNSRGSGSSFDRDAASFRGNHRDSAPILDLPAMNPAEIEQSSNAPKTIKDVLKESGQSVLGSALSNDSDLSSSECSPLKNGIRPPPLLQAPDLNASRSSEESYTPTRPHLTHIGEPGSIDVEKNSIHFDAIRNARNVAEAESGKNVGHFDAIKRARNVAAEFEQSFSSGNDITAEETKKVHDDPNDGSVPILMNSAPGSDSQNSDNLNPNSPIKPVLNIAHSMQSDSHSGDRSSNSRNQSQFSRGQNRMQSVAPPDSQPNLANVDTSSPEYARWWFYHFGRGRGRGGGMSSNGMNNRGGGMIAPHL